MPKMPPEGVKWFKLRKKSLKNHNKPTNASKCQTLLTNNKQCFQKFYISWWF